MDKVIIFPTDTVYGIGTSIYNKEGIEKIYDIKGRSYNKPIAVLCANIEQVKEFAVMSDDAFKIANEYWPGGLTLILRTNEKYFNMSGEKTIGVRIPNHKKAIELLIKYGPMKTTSINKSGEEPINDYKVLVEKYADLVDEVYENKEYIQRVSSTVINLTNGLDIIREGKITKQDIERVLKKSL